MTIDADKNIKLNAEQAAEMVAERKKSFQNKILLHNAITSQSSGETFDRKVAIDESEDNLVALDAQGALQEMLAAQMTSIHLLQQRNLALAIKSINISHMQAYTNSAVKLANCFTQQASLLAKLQGKGGQKITIEKVIVNEGAQAAVGIINGGGNQHREIKK